MKREAKLSMLDLSPLKCIQILICKGGRKMIFIKYMQLHLLYCTKMNNEAFSFLKQLRTEILIFTLILLHSERPKLYAILFQSAKVLIW